MDPLVDLAEIRNLLQIVERHGLEGLEVSDAESQVTIVAQPLAAPLAAPAAAPLAAEAEEVVDDGDKLCLRSPITGVFYRSPSPGEPPFVQVGDVLEAEDPVCLIEAMKIFNEIPAGVAGRLSRILATNEQLVVSGEVLMEFEPLEDSA